MVSKFSDVAVGLSEDKLGFRDYADGVIATMESVSKEDTPFTIGIFGSWGSGKTSFMQIMRELLESRGYETIFFKSWEYGNEEKPWIPFMIKVVDELFKEEINKTELIKNIILFSTDVVLQTYSQGNVSARGILDLSKRSRKNIPLKEWSDEDANIVIERVTKIEDFKNKIKERAEKSKKGKIIIFIDDLDRIPEEKIVDFLNTLKIFLDIRGCIFVLGCDYNILDSALKQRYKGEIYDDYFDKIVQTEFYIPKISEQAIKNYLHFLTGWSDKEIEECTQLVIHSIGGNPRKIKRVVNATMLIKSVFERRLFTFLQAFERPKPMVRFERGREGKEGAPKEPMALKREISRIFTPAEVFDLLFDKKVLFKLVCMREQWFTYYENILIDEEKQQDLFSTTEEQGDKSKEDLAPIKFMKEDSPVFQELVDLKTYLTLLEISSPEAGISIEYAEPAKLPINLFNRYMLFERINKGKVEETIIREKIEQVDWKGNLSSYHFFSEVLSAFGYVNLLRDLFKRDRIQSITKRIKDSSSDPRAIGGLLDSVRRIEEETARVLLNETKDIYADKIKASTDPAAIAGLLDTVRWIEEEKARELLNETKDTYADKIKASTDPEAIGRLLYSVRWIEEEKARELLNETKDTYADKISASTDPMAIGGLLYGVRRIEEETARELLNGTKDTYVDKISASTDPRAIEWLLDAVRKIDEETARELFNQTKATITDKIKASTDPRAIAGLLDTVSKIEEEKARVLLNQTKATITDKIKASTDPEAIGRLLYSVRWIEEEKARELLNETKDTYADKIKASTDPGAIGRLLDSVSGIEEEKARELLNETKGAIADKIKASADLGAIGGLLDSVSGIEEEKARELLNETKGAIADKIKASVDLGAIWTLFESVSEIDEETAKWLKKETKFKSKNL